MDTALLKQARNQIGNVPILVNVVSKRVKQLNSGHRPLVRRGRNEEPEDVALREIAEGKLTLEIDFSAVSRVEEEE
jgi:DNA-directed RNA polymerase subunit omega